MDYWKLASRVPARRLPVRRHGAGNRQDGSRGLDVRPVESVRVKHSLSIIGYVGPCVRQPMGANWKRESAKQTKA